MSVHNLRSESMQPGDVYVGRGSRQVKRGKNGVLGGDGYFGNPFKVGEDGNHERPVRRFEVYARERIASDPEYRGRVKALHGRRLFCWCAPELCHAEVLERLATEIAAEQDDSCELILTWDTITPDGITHTVKMRSPDQQLSPAIEICTWNAVRDLIRAWYGKELVDSTPLPAEGEEVPGCVWGVRLANAPRTVGRLALVRAAAAEVLLGQNGTSDA